MKKLISLFILGVSISFVTNAQSPVTYEKGFGGYKFSQNGKAITPKIMSDIYKEVPAAATLMNKAKVNYNFAMVLGYAGGFLVGYPLGSALGGGEPEWALAGIGAGLIILAIPINKTFTKNAIKATDIYNNRTSTETTSYNINIGPTNYGYGLTFNF
jgi:hypothetical protein